MRWKKYVGGIVTWLGIFLFFGSIVYFNLTLGVFAVALLVIGILLNK